MLRKLKVGTLVGAIAAIAAAAGLDWFTEDFQVALTSLITSAIVVVSTILSAYQTTEREGNIRKLKVKRP